MGHFLVGMGEGAMLESGTFSCGDGEGAMLESGTFSCEDGGRGHVGIWDISLWGWGNWNMGARAFVPPWGRGKVRKHFCAAGPFLQNSGQGSARNTCKKHKDQRPLEWLFGDFRLLEFRNSFVNGFICSEKD